MIFYLDSEPDVGDDWKEIVPKVMRLKDDKTAVIVSAYYKNHEFSFYDDINIFRDYDHYQQRLENDHIFTFENNQIDWNHIKPSNPDKIIFVQSHHTFVDPDNKMGAQMAQNDYYAAWEYQKNQRRSRRCKSYLFT